MLFSDEIKKMFYQFFRMLFFTQKRPISNFHSDYSFRFWIVLDCAPHRYLIGRIAFDGGPRSRNFIVTGYKLQDNLLIMYNINTVLLLHLLCNNIYMV